MKYLLLFLVIALPLIAVTETASVTVPGAQAIDLATIVESWIQGQVKPDGSLKYPVVKKSDRRQTLFDAILRDGVRRVVRQACSQFPADCPAVIKSHVEDKVTAASGVDTEIEAIIQ